MCIKYLKMYNSYRLNYRNEKKNSIIVLFHFCSRYFSKPISIFEVINLSEGKRKQIFYSTIELYSHLYIYIVFLCTLYRKHTFEYIQIHCKNNNYPTYVIYLYTYLI